MDSATLYYVRPSRTAAKEMAKDLAEDVADGLLSEANAALVQSIYLVRTLRGCGAGTLSIIAVKEKLVEALQDAQACIDRELDNEHLATDRHQLDLSELEGA